MKTAKPDKEKRALKNEVIQADLVITGGGMAGTCSAITAARAGIQVVLIQDRPVLGGNASSEIRLWILGATSHMGNNNRWAREGGVIDEILTENLYRNREGNPLILDTILLEKVTREENIRLLLNTAVYDLEKDGPGIIRSVIAFCSQNSTRYELIAPLFMDASGDGIVGFLAGAAFRMGAEDPGEFNEGLAPDSSYGELLGHTLYFYSKDVGQPVKYIPPSFALKEYDRIPKIRSVKVSDQGAYFWWVEYGGRFDTVHQSEEIKWELWKIVYGIWDYIKNSGNYPEAETYTLEWVGTIPGKRESRRFEGDYMLSQPDLVEQRQHEDAVAFGGWAMDLHPADGVYSDQPSCNQFHTKGIYQIPYRCYYSKNIRNLFLAGRIISCTHVAFGSTRVMATCAIGGQAAGMAAALCAKMGLMPSDLMQGSHLDNLQRALNLSGQSIPHIPLQDEKNLMGTARVQATSTCILREIPADGPWLSLEKAACQMIPVPDNNQVHITILVKATEPTLFKVDLRIAGKPGNYTPDIIRDTQVNNLEAGEQEITYTFSKGRVRDQYAFICFPVNKAVQIKCSNMRYTGILSLYNKFNYAVSNFGKQEAPKGSGIESFEFWTPEKRPEGHNIAMSFYPAVELARVDNIRNGFTRPGRISNAWIADPTDALPTVFLYWKQKVSIGRIILFFDPDYDHPMESVLMGHPEDRVPFVVRNYKIEDGQGRLLHQAHGNYLGRNEILLEDPTLTDRIVITLEHPADNCPAAIFEVCCYSDIRGNQRIKHMKIK
jgi:hypothetical protein